MEPVGMKVTLRVNDTAHELSVDPRLTLLDALRDVLGLTLRRRDAIRARAARARSSSRVNGSCLTLAAACDGQHVVTIEGFATGDEVTNTATLAHGERDGRPGRYVPAAQVAAICNQVTPRASRETRGCPVERKLWLCAEVPELREIL
jgi:xanthine dehydrogenase YagT iron-sulfur-binding subunit